MPLTPKTDITKADSQLEHEQLNSLINSMADAVIAVDKRAKVQLYNAAALNILDINTIRKGSAIDSLFEPVDADNQPIDIGAMILATTLPTTNRDLRLRYDDDSFINVYISIAPVHLGYGQTGEQGYVLLLRDITREKSLEDERNEFISVVSHELRTPIAIAEGNISNAQFIVGKSGDPAAVKAALEQAHSQVLFLADMINDLSTLSRAERNALEVTVEPINVAALITDLNHNYAPQAADKGLHLRSKADPRLELLQSSQLYVREILQNFITNAIKYTAKGFVDIGAAPHNKGVLFTITDSGIGISKADQERVFDKFFRSEDYRTREASGTGLGLYVTMKLSRLIHADISLKSELNQGSTFSIYIPNLH